MNCADRGARVDPSGSGFIAVFFGGSINPSSRAKVPDEFKMTEEEVELTELPASMPRGKGGLSYLGQTAPMDAKTDR